MTATIVGLDLAKNVMQVHGLDATGAAVLRRQLRRGQVIGFFAGLPPCLVGTEACATAHHWAREIAALGHEVRLVPAQYAEAYVKRGKNHATDAEAICEAVSRPSMRFVQAFVAEHISAHAMIADVALHAPDKAGDQRNHHAHVLVTTREVSGDGFGRKVEAWTKPALVRGWREGWAEVENAHLRRALGQDAPQVSAKSLADQGLEREPTIHLGPAASAMERRGERSDRGDVNRAIREGDQDRRRLDRDVRQAEDEAVAKAPRAARGTQALGAEMTALHADLLREHAKLAQTRDAIVVSGARGSRQVAAEVLEPARQERGAARAKLARVEARAAAVRTRRNALASWIRNPARMIWAKHAELNAIAAAQAENRLASARLDARQLWLRSEAGRTYVAQRVEPASIAARGTFRQRRTLERRMRRVAKRAEAVENVRVKALIARELGHHSLEAPTRTVGTTQFVRAMDASTLSVIRQHAPDAQRRAYDRVKAQQRARVRGPAPEL